MPFADDCADVEPAELTLEQVADCLAVPLYAAEIMAARGLFPGAWLDLDFRWRVPEDDVLAVASLARGAA